MTDDDLTTAYILGVEHIRDKMHQQADEIERLRAENEKLREALKPFASYSDWLSEEEEETGNRAKDTDSHPVSIQYLRAASAAIRESGE
jgi:regulator of replication initiation timing